MEGYSLGVKLVRGAYHPHEVAAHSSTAAPSDAQQPHTLSISPEPVPPVWLEKADTDARYDACVRALVAADADDLPSNLPQRERPLPSPFLGLRPQLSLPRHRSV